MHRLWLVPIAAVACGGSPPWAPDSPPAPDPEAVAAPEPEPTPAPETPAPVTIPEIEARAILAERFRAAGYRILYDVPVEIGAVTVAVDGYDPEKQVGFEYRAAAEAAVWDGEVPPEIDARLLVIDATDRDTVEARAQKFLSAIGD